MSGLGDYMGVKFHICIGGTLVRDDHRKLEAGVHVVVGTPGRVLDVIKRSSLSNFEYCFLKAVLCYCLLLK